MKHLLKIIFFLVSSITIALAFSVNGLGAEYVQTADKLIYLPLLMREYPLKTMPIAFMGWPTRQTVDIYTVNDNGGQLRNLTNNPSKIHTLNWSPDGAKIVFNSLMNGYYDIYTVNADGGDLKQLTNDLDPDSGPSW